MKQIHIWPSHVRLDHVDHVIFRPAGEPLSVTLVKLRRLGIDTGSGNVVVHPGVPLE